MDDLNSSNGAGNTPFKLADRCYHPECPVPSTSTIEGKTIRRTEVVHIVANSPQAPRYDPAMTKDERNNSSNLILLCPPHHESADRDIAKHPVARLLQWKQAIEIDLKVGLDRLGQACSILRTAMRDIARAIAHN